MRLEVVTAEGFASAVADEWQRRLEDIPGLRICLPTGATPRPVYRELADRGLDLSGTRAFLLDEFLLPPGNPYRCDVMIQRDFLDLMSPELRPPLDRFDAEAPDLEAEVARYREAVSTEGLDLTLLGIGRNGHLALNEPGSGPDTAARVVDLHPVTAATVAVEAGTDAAGGMTLGLAEILASREVWLLVTGAGKAEILEAAMRGPIGPDVPASWLRDHDRAVVFADEAAAALLG